MTKVHRGYLYKTDGTIVKVRPENGKKFDYKELQAAVGGYIESLVSGIKNCKQMYANEEGLINGLPPNPHTQNICNMKVYSMNGYPSYWRVSGNVIAILSEVPDQSDVSLLTVSQALENN